jgi:heme oxygenase
MTDPTPPSTRTLMEHLRDATAELHAAAEHHPFQTSLVRGEASLEDYGRWLGQMLAIHDALETALVAQRTLRAELATVVREELLMAPRLRDDLAALGHAAGEPLPATARFVAEIGRLASEHPAALLGCLYVLEGSKNGNRFIARALRKAYADRPTASFLYLDAHGEGQRGLWAEFKAAANVLTLADGDLTAMTRAAEETFRAVTAVSDDLRAVATA